jgi:hypothetical protein
VKSKSIMKCMLLALAFISLCFMMSPGQTFAGIGGSDVPTVPSPVIVGQTGVDFSFTITNQSTNPNDVHNVEIKRFFFTTACGSNVNPTAHCPAASTETNVIVIPSGNTGTGEAGTACAGKTFTITSTGFPSEYLFTPNATVILGPSNPDGPLASCKVNFKVNILAAPVHDSSPSAGKQTSQLATTVDIIGGVDAGMQDVVTEEFGGAQGSSTLTIMSPSFTVDKTGPALSKVGHTVTYNYSITNTGDSDLDLVSVIDDKAGNLTSTASSAGCNVLSVAETCNFTKDYLVQASDPDPLVNTVTVIYNVPQTTINLTPITDTHSVNLFQPNVKITKECECKPKDPSIGCLVGDPIDYKITVTNTSSSDSPNMNCTIKDPTLNVNKIVSNFAPGDQNVTTKNNVPFPDISEDCLDNTAKVDCVVVDPWGNQKSDQATCTVCKETQTSSGAEEPYKAAVENDKDVPPFYISPKLFQFTHYDTWYYEGCNDVLSPLDPRVNLQKCKIDGGVAICPSRCSERFDSKTVENQPEVCCTSKTVADSVGDLNFVHCPDTGTNPHPPVKTALTTAGNSGWYEWVIALPKKPVGEMNIEIECGVLKPNAWKFNEYEAIEKCAAETGEPIASGLCVRVVKGLLKSGALPKIEVIAHPGCQNTFTPFHLTSYRNPGTYVVKKSSGHIINNAATQVLDGKYQTRIALKPCMNKTILIKWPTEGTVNALGETEANLEAGDLIKVRMDIPVGNTVDVYCSKYSVLIGGIGEPDTLLDDNYCGCISDPNCQF